MHMFNDSLENWWISLMIEMCYLYWVLDLAPQSSSESLLNKTLLQSTLPIRSERVFCPGNAYL